MPAYNFQKQFVPMIIEMWKPHTIRPERKHPTKVGDYLQLYTGQRTKACQLIAVAPCVKVERIEIYPHLHQVVIEHNPLSAEWIVELSQRDGFQSRDAFFEFFMRYPPEIREDKLRLIWWDPRKMIKADEFVTEVKDETR
ncbi:MAG: ASCH domain-containing protein [Chloroflexota bacterium]